MYGTTMRNYNANRASGTKDEKKGFFSKKSMAKENKRAKKNEDTRYMKLEASEIAADEIDDFIHIQNELERISITVETLQLWAEKMLANGIIDADTYNARKNK